MEAPTEHPKPMGVDRIFSYFPELSQTRAEAQLRALESLYMDWNAKINVISRKDIQNLYERHVLHSLALVKFTGFEPDARILDLGTGGGFPGIPLAIYYPDVEFLLIDGRKKKLKVVDEVAEAVGLSNIRTQHVRAEDCNYKSDFVVSRAVAPLAQLLSWSRPLIRTNQEHGIPNGLLCLKGGRHIDAEVNELGGGEYVERVGLDRFFEEDFFQEKEIVYVQG
jgi:16S rRNA (guanine527-N7)-methyltransferase